jgi:hypothetical protein
MEEWLSQVPGAAMGLLAGLACGFYFEHRQARVAREHAAELREDNEELETLVADLRNQVSRLQTNVTTNLGVSPSSTLSRASRSGDLAELAPEILAFVKRRLDASGGVAQSSIMEHFYGLYGAEAVEVGIRTLIERGELAGDKRTVRIPL